MKSKILPFILIIAMILTVLAGCSDKDAIEPAVAEKVTNVYKTETLNLPNNIQISSNFVVSKSDDRIYVIGVEIIDMETYEIQNHLYSFDFNGENPESEPINIEGVSYISNFDMTPDGNLLVLATEFDPETEEMKTHLLKYSRNGEMIFIIEPASFFDTNDNAGGLGIGRPFSSIYISTFTTDGDGNIYIPNESVIVVLNPDGEKLFTINTDATYLSTIDSTAEGQVFVKYYDRTVAKDVMRLIDFNKKALGDIIDVPDMNNNAMAGRGVSFSMSGNQDVMIGAGYDLYLKNTQGLYGYNYADSDPVLLCDWINSDINPSMMGNITVLSPEKMIYTAYDDFAGGQRINLMTHIPDDEVKAKYLIRFASLYSDMTINTAIINFNRNSEEYRIVVVNYAGDQEKLESDIVAGKMPDIVCLTEEMPVKNYISKGLFTDLYQYFDSDPDITREILLNCVRAPFEIDGKLYQLLTSFTIDTVAGKTANVGDSTSWTIEEVLNIINNMDNGKTFTSYEVREELANILLTKGIDSFIDYEKGTCNFDSAEFIEILNYLISLEEADYEEYHTSEEYNTDRYKSLREDDAYVTMAELNSFTDYLQLTFQFGFEDITLKGYPASNGSGTIISGSSYAISEKSQLKDGAWQFLKYLISDELQTSQRFVMNWPSTVAGIEFAASEEMKREYTFNYNGGYSASFTSGTGGGMMISSVSSSMYGGESLGGEEAKLTQEDVDAMLGFLNSDFSTENFNEQLIEIISEELQIFYEGMKSAEETAKVIQSRASTYISENT